MTIQEKDPIAAALSVRPTKAEPVTLSAPEAAQLPPLLPAAPRRLMSLDVFRGITIAAMLLVNNPGRGTAYAPLEHAEWNGWTPTDLIFPFFLFIVGVAMAFSLAKRSAGASKLKLLGGIWLRAFSIFLLGALLQAMPFSGLARAPDGYEMITVLRVIAICYTVCGIFAVLYPWKRSPHWNWIIPMIGVGLWVLMVLIHFADKQALQGGIGSSFDFGNGAMTPYRFRIPGVLQRIGLVYGIAATIVLFSGWRTALLMTVVLCAAYSVLMLKMPFSTFEKSGKSYEHEVGSLTREDNLARRMDEWIFGRHNYASYPDPEGLLSTMPAVGTALLGFVVGAWLRSKRPAGDRAAGLVVTGIFVALLGLCLDRWLMPINKQIWTPSFVVFCAGMGMIGLGMLYWIVDVVGYRRWALPFVVYGTNAIAAFVAAGIVTRIGLMARFDQPGKDAKISLIGICQNHAAQAVHQLSAWMQQHANMQPFDSDANKSLVYSLGYIIVVLLILTPLYAKRVFVKV